MAKKSTTKKTVAKKAAPKKVATKKVAKKKVAQKAASTPSVSAVAQIDIGFGNSLFIRGEGAGLSWEQGILMDCLDSSAWTWTGKSKKPVLFKVLINDEIWSTGENFEIPAGEAITFTPSF